MPLCQSYPSDYHRKRSLRDVQETEPIRTSLKGVAVTTGTATTAKTVTVVSWHCILWDKQKEGKLLSRTAKTVKTVMKATPLKLNPPLPVSRFKTLKTRASFSPL